MLLAKGKRGIFEWGFTGQLILYTLGFVLVFSIITYAMSRANEKTSEIICRGSNAIRYGLKIEKGPIKTPIGPRGCKTIDKKDLPGKDYKFHAAGVKEGAKAELRDLIARCWWMWIEGKHPNYFGQSTFALLSQHRCFVCYTFSLDKNTEFGLGEFAASLNEPYDAIDTSDRCASNGGGRCMGSCSESSGFPKEVDSIKCEDASRPKCCVTKDYPKDECINNGGSCETRQGYKPFDEWACKTGRCYVDEKNFAAYYDYVQGTKGVGGGAGFIAFQENLDKFASGKKYGVVFVSPGDRPTWGTLGLGAATLASGAGTAAATYYSPVFKGQVLAAGTTLTYGFYGMTENSGVPAGYNFIYVSEFDKIKDKCAVQAGID